MLQLAEYPTIQSFAMAINTAQITRIQDGFLSFLSSFSNLRELILVVDHTILPSNLTKVICTSLGQNDTIMETWCRVLTEHFNAVRDAVPDAIIPQLQFAEPD
jgi:hypothetical protein